MLTTDEMCDVIDKAKRRIEELEATAATMLHALKYARNHLLNPANSDTDDLLKTIYAAWDHASVAGIQG